MTDERERVQRKVETLERELFDLVFDSASLTRDGVTTVTLSRDDLLEQKAREEIGKKTRQRLLEDRNKSTRSALQEDALIKKRDDSASKQAQLKAAAAAHPKLQQHVYSALGDVIALVLWKGYHISVGSNGYIGIWKGPTQAQPGTVEMVDFCAVGTEELSSAAELHGRSEDLQAEGGPDATPRRARVDERRWFVGSISGVGTVLILRFTPRDGAMSVALGRVAASAEMHAGAISVCAFASQAVMLVTCAPFEPIKGWSLSLDCRWKLDPWTLSPAAGGSLGRASPLEAGGEGDSVLRVVDSLVCDLTGDTVIAGTRGGTVLGLQLDAPASTDHVWRANVVTQYKLTPWQDSRDALLEEIPSVAAAAVQLVRWGRGGHAQLVVVVGCSDGSLRLIDFYTNQPIGERPVMTPLMTGPEIPVDKDSGSVMSSPIHALFCWQTGNLTLAVTVDAIPMLRVWDLLRGTHAASTRVAVSSSALGLRVVESGLCYVTCQNEWVVYDLSALLAKLRAADRKASSSIATPASTRNRRSTMISRETPVWE